MPRPIRPATLQSIARNEGDVLVDCNNCHAHWEIPIDSLLRDFWPDLPVRRLIDHICCGRCGSVWIESRPLYPNPGTIVNTNWYGG